MKHSNLFKVFAFLAVAGLLSTACSNRNKGFRPKKYEVTDAKIEKTASEDKKVSEWGKPDVHIEESVGTDEIQGASGKSILFDFPVKVAGEKDSEATVGFSGVVTAEAESKGLVGASVLFPADQLGANHQVESLCLNNCEVVVALLKTKDGSNLEGTGGSTRAYVYEQGPEDLTKTWSYRFDRDNVDGMGQALRMVRSLMGEGQIEISEGLKSALDAAELRLVNVAYEGEVLDASFEKDSFHPAAAISSSPRVASENASESFDEAIAKDSFHPAAAISSSPEIVSEPRSSGMKIRPNVQTSKVQEEDFSYSGQLHADRQEELNRISAVETSVPTVKQNKAHPLFQRARKD